MTGDGDPRMNCQEFSLHFSRGSVKILMKWKAEGRDD